MRRSKALLSFICAAVLCLSVMPALADTTWAVVYGTGSLNVRATPSTGGIWRGSAARGDWVQIIYPSGSNWYYCHVPSKNVTGFMSGNYLKTAGSAGTPSSNTGVINNPGGSGYVNMRDQPGYFGNVIYILHNNDVVELKGSVNGWYCVTFNGISGYVTGQFVTTTSGGAPTETKSAVVQTGNSGKLNMRSEPSMSGAVKASYANGTNVTVLLEGNEFDMVSVGGVTGFMAAKYLKVNGSGGGTTPVPTPPTPATGGWCIVKNDNALSTLNLRQTPSTNGRVLARLHNGVRLEMVEQGETWCKVYMSDTGTTGYVMTKYVHLYNLPVSPKKTVSNGSSYANLRSKGNYSASVIMRVYSGSEVTVLIPGDVWTRVRYETHEGYMMTHFLK